MTHEMVVSLAFLAVLAVAASHALLSRKRGLNVASTTSQWYSLPPTLWNLIPPSRCADEECSDDTLSLLETAPLSKASAEEILDWLEAIGFQRLEVSYVPEKGVVVRDPRG